MKRVVFITGAAGGLGKAFVAECASRGWDLFLTDISERALDDVARGAERMYGIDVQTRACDLTDPDDRAALWQAFDETGLRIHMLINVAGIDYEGPFDQRPVDELNTIVRLNVESTLDTTRRVLPRRVEGQPLHIVNVSSLAAFYPMPVKAVYAASKRFLLDWSLALRQELRSQNVTVTALCPAGMPTHPACVRSIEAQGFMGRITTVNVGTVTRLTIDRALKGRGVVVPGVVNQILRIAGSLLSPSAVAFLINRRWRKSHAASHGPQAEPTSTAPVEPLILRQPTAVS